MKIKMDKYKKRNSLSVSAQDFPNKIKKGNDGKEYISRSNVNQIYKWYRIKYIDECKTAKEYYMQFPENYLQKKFYKYNINNLEKNLKKLCKELEKYNIYLIKVGWKDVYNFQDYAWEAAEKYIQNKYFKKDKIPSYEILDKANFLFYTEKSLFFSQNIGELVIKWNLNGNNIKKITFDVLRKIFKNKFIEPKNISKSIIIKL
jgi:hypothetical protein